MSENLNLRTALLAPLAFGALFFVGCSGDTDGGSAGQQNIADGVFVSTDDTVGTIDLNLSASKLAVSRTAGFSVAVRNANGAPVPNIRIACDTEQGLALIEPNTGVEMTDAGGNMSGVLGCAAPGSFQIGCRLPIGANKRQFQTVVCTGDVPAGFTGFPNSGGGGLFGGVDTTDDGSSGGVGAGNVRVTAISFSDGGQDNTTSIDTTMNPDCDGDPGTNDPETFTDTRVTFTLVNEGNQELQLVSFNFSVPNSNAAGTTFTSSQINFQGALAVPANGGSVQASSEFLRGAGGQKTFYNSGTPISVDGFRNVTFRIRVRNEFGDTGEVTVRTNLSFGPFNRC